VEEVIVPDEIMTLAQERVEAKKNKDYKLADMIRENLAQQ
jgi:cysteinyl-tRNA synthetase